MNRIEAHLKQIRSQGSTALVAFVTAGDPNLEATELAIDALVNAGVDLIEIGLPYSDPLADGPVIQASFNRSLAAGTKLKNILLACKNWTSKYPSIPFVTMGSYSLVYSYGPAKFLEAAAASGLAGAIIPDLPVEEAAELRGLASKLDFSLIQLITPTTPQDRAKLLVESSSGFIYVVSVTGITGTQTAQVDALTNQIDYLRSITSLPLCVGFGVSTPEQANSLKPLADGVIVGSALVKHLASNVPLVERIRQLGEHAKNLKAALR